MSEDKKTNEGTDNPEEDSGDGDKPEATKIIKQQSERIKELEAERDKRIMDDAKKQMGGITEGGKQPEKPKEETDKEYRTRIDKELAEGKTEFGN